MNKIIVICGPTATGKTALGARLAKKFNGEIISADSRQVYQGMDVGTGKDLPKSAKLKVKSEKLQLKVKSFRSFKPYRFNKVPVWLLDVVEPDQEFNVACYYKLARQVIEDIWWRKKLPFLVGGTGFYIKALIDGIGSLGVKPDWALREKLETEDIQKLGERLQKLNPSRWKGMNKSDRQNPRRLIRAIEIAMTNRQRRSLHSTPHTLNTLFIGLMAPYKLLYQRIDQRVEERVERGALEEVKKLFQKGYAWDLPSMSGMGYREFKDFFEKKATIEAVIQRWKFDEHGYARRQMTWFKKDKRINWFDITCSGLTQEVEKLIRSWYNEKQHK